MKSYSQIGQDLDVIKFFNNKRNGYFVDVGAAFGTNLSNTFLLEKDFGWNGICVEPHPDYFNKLIKNRDVKCFKFAAYDKDNETVEFMAAGVLSGIINHLARKNKDAKIVKVKTKTLNFILKVANAPNYIDYISIDTEGSEVNVLNGIDFNKYVFGFITIEHNLEEPKRTEIRNILENNGYVFLRQNKFDDYYCHESVKK